MDHREMAEWIDNPKSAMLFTKEIDVLFNGTTKLVCGIDKNVFAFTAKNVDRAVFGIFQTVKSRFPNTDITVIGFNKIIDKKLNDLFNPKEQPLQLEALKPKFIKTYFEWLGKATETCLSALEKERIGKLNDKLNPKEEKMSEFKIGDKVIVIKSLDLKIPDKYFDMDLEISNVFEQKIKELELKLQLNDSNLDNAKFNHSIKQAAIQAEIEELKKPKYELFVPKYNEKYFYPNSKGDVANSYMAGTPCKNAYDFFKSHEQCKPHAKLRQILDALANFAAHNNSKVKDSEWDGVYWHITWDSKSDEYSISANRITKELGVVCFRSFNIAGAALQMLKTEKLI